MHSEVPFKAVMGALCQNAEAQEDIPRFQSALNLENGDEQGSLPGFSKCSLKVKRLQVCAESAPSSGCQGLCYRNTMWIVDFMHLY